MGWREDEVGAAAEEMCEGSAISGRGLDEHVVSFAAAECEMTAADFDFERVAHRGGANQCDRGANEEAHFAEAHGRGPGFGKFADDGARAKGELGEFHGRAHRGGKARSGAAAERLDDDALRRSVAEGDPRAVDGTHERPAATNLRDER